MQDNTLQRFSRYFIGFMMLFSCISFGTDYLLNRYIYDMPPLNPFNIIKYILISSMNYFDMNVRIFIAVPDELYSYMCDNLGWSGNAKILVDLYPEIFNALPTAWIYKASLCWFYLSMIISIVLSCQLCRKYNPEKIKKQTYLRGVQKVTAKELCSSVNRQAIKNDGGICIGQMHLPRDIETRHFMVLGTTGTGKSYLLMSMIQQMQQRGTRMILVDRKGEFYSMFGDSQKDKIFNPYDKRHTRWSFFNEFKIPKKMDHLPEALVAEAQSLFSVSTSNKNAHFYKAAADVFCSGMCYLALNGKTTSKDIKTFFTAGGDKLHCAIKTLPEGFRDGLGHLGQDGTGEHVEAIISCIMERAKDFGCFVGKDGEFSVRDWVKDKHAGNLYISTAGPNDTSFTSIVTMMIDMVGREIKSFPEVRYSRLAIVIDELAALPPLKTLSFLLNETRSKGVGVILANQTLQMLNSIYTKEVTNNYFSMCNTKFIFKMPEPTDAEYISRAIGEQEVLRVTRSQNNTSRGILSADGTSKGITESEQVTKESIIMPAQIQSLAKRHVIVQIPDAPVAEITLPTMKFSPLNKPYDPIEIDEISINEIRDILAPKVEASQQIKKIPIESASTENPEEENFLKSPV